jgi:capsular exopolysaccharide synthesis family protein
MDLRHVIAALRRWWYVTTSIVLLIGGAATAYALLRSPEYRATSTVFFSLNRSPAVSELAQGSTYTQEVVKSYSQLVTLPVVLSPVISRLGLDETPPELARRVSIQAQPDTVIADITVTDASADGSAELANAIANELGNAVRTLSPGGPSSPAAVSVTRISEAQIPQSPASPNVPLLIGIGVIGGLMLGVAAAIVLELVKSPLITEEVAKKAAPVVGKIARDPKARSRRLPLTTHPQLPITESFHALRTNLRRLEGSQRSLCLVVASALPKEGRTTVAANLAIAMSHSFHSVLLVDADLRRPALARTFGLPQQPGLSELLQGETSLYEVTQTWHVETWRESRVHVVPAGSRATDPSELLARPAMSKMLEAAKFGYEFVLMDTAPLLPVTDGALLAAQVDGALLVVHSRRTTERDFAEAVTALQLAGAELSGIIVNSVPVPRRFRGRRKAAEVPAGDLPAT